MPGCHGEGGAGCQGETPEEERQHPECTACSAHTHQPGRYSAPENTSRRESEWLSLLLLSLAFQSSCSKTDLTGCGDDDCKVGLTRRRRLFAAAHVSPAVALQLCVVVQDYCDHVDGSHCPPQDGPSCTTPSKSKENQGESRTLGGRGGSALFSSSGQEVS